MLRNQLGNKLTGAAGSDKLFGEAGNDDLIGGFGGDTLDGGAGNDTFWFAPGGGRDIIKGFGDKAGHQDVINLRDYNTSFDSLNITGSGKNTIITIDGVGSNDLQITLIGVKPANLGADDFSF